MKAFWLVTMVSMVAVAAQANTARFDLSNEKDFASTQINAFEDNVQSVAVVLPAGESWSVSLTSNDDSGNEGECNGRFVHAKAKKSKKGKVIPAARLYYVDINVGTEDSTTCELKITRQKSDKKDEKSMTIGIYAEGT